MLQIFDANGVEHLVDLQVDSNNRFTFKIDHLASGVYLIKAYLANKELRTYKIIKE